MKRGGRKPPPPAKRASAKRGPKVSTKKLKVTFIKIRKPIPKRVAGKTLLGKSTRKRPGSALRKRASNVEQAFQTLGTARVRRGRTFLGGTRWLTPTKRGMAALVRALADIDAARAGKTFSYDLNIQFNGPDGHRRAVSLSGLGVPRAKDVKRRKGESARAAFSRTVLELVRHQVFGTVNVQLGGSSRLGLPFEGKKMNKVQAFKALNKAKRSRAIRFRVSFYRET